MGLMSFAPNGMEEGASRTLKSDIARGFGNASRTYEAASRLQRLMGNTMLEKRQLREIPHAGSRILDLGCGTGWFTRKLLDIRPLDVLTGIDLSPGMLQEARRNSPEQIGWLVGDAERLPVPDECCDLIFSNLMIQWCNDPCKVFRECQRVLRPGGFLMMSTLLEGTLCELKTAWQAVDPEHQHVNRFEAGHSLPEKVRAELPEAAIETRTLRLAYESPMSLAGELRYLGAGFRGAERRKAITAPGRMRAMCRQYPKQPDGTVTASYEAAWIYWQKKQAR